MHEGEHGILDLDCDHEHEHDHLPAAGDRRMVAGRVLAAAIVSASVVLFLVWRFL